MEPLAVAFEAKRAGHAAQTKMLQALDQRARSARREHNPSSWNQLDGLCLRSKRLRPRISRQMEPPSSSICPKAALAREVAMMIGIISDTHGLLRPEACE